MKNMGSLKTSLAGIVDPPHYLVTHGFPYIGTGLHWSETWEWMHGEPWNVLYCVCIRLTICDCVVLYVFASFHAVATRRQR